MSDARALAWLDKLLDLDLEKRADLLLQLKAEDPVLHGRLTRMLAGVAADDSSIVLASPVVDALREAQGVVSATLNAGQTFAGHRLIRELGRGGMSVVWLAERADGVVKREVALKLPLLVFSSPLDVDRFDREKDALAALTHPNIARLYDAGVTASGQPYMVLEAVNGEPITKYCDRRGLGIPERLRLFDQVLSAVEHAHKHLIVHRDLKPSNVLVDASGQVKLLDFGIAKILDPRALPEDGAHTVTAGSLMTPEYASPEQFLGETITTATDVYSLGCVLYELLTGHRPLPLVSRRPHEIAQAVLQNDPEKPSHVVAEPAFATRGMTSMDTSSIAATPFGKISADRLQRQLRGDLDTIVLKAIRKEPASRYESVGHFADDLRRHLRAEPILARKSTIGYKVGRFVARHKAAVSAAALVLLSIGAGLALAIYQARIARANELRAEQRFNEVRRLANSMLFEIHDSIAQLPGATAARQLLIQRAQEYLENLTWDSSSDSALLGELAAAHTRLATVLGNPSNSNLGNTDAAIGNYRKAIAILEFLALRQPESVDTARDLAMNYTRLTMALTQVGDMDGRELNIGKALAILEPLSAREPNHQDISRNLAFAYSESAFIFRNKREPGRALELFEKAQAVYERLHKTYPDHPVFQQNLAHNYRHVGTLLALQGRLQEALDSYRTASVMNEAMLKLKPDNAETQFNVTLSDSNIAFVLGEMGNVDEALALYRKVLAVRSALSAADPLDERARTGVAETLNYIGVNLERKNDLAAALKSFEASQAVRKTLAKNNPADDSHTVELAWIDAKIGRTHARMAFASHVKKERQLELCRDARERIQRSLPKWIESQQTQVRLGAGTNKELADLRQTVEDCERLIAR